MGVEENADDLRQYRVVDAEGREVGPVLSYWTEERGARDRPTFAAVQAGRLMRRAHVVPLEGARLDEERRLLHVAFSRAVILDAPVIDLDAPFTAAHAEAARTHYLGKAAPQEMLLHGEVPRAETRVVAAGGVRLRKVVRKEIVHVPVEVLREEFILEPVPAGEPWTDADAEGIPTQPFQEGSVYIPRYAEEPVIRKTTEVLEAVRASRQEETERRVVAADLRREDVEVDREPR